MCETQHREKLIQGAPPHPSPQHHAPAAQREAREAPPGWQPSHPSHPAGGAKPSPQSSGDGKPPSRQMCATRTPNVRRGKLDIDAQWWSPRPPHVRTGWRGDPQCMSQLRNVTEKARPRNKHQLRPPVHTCCTNSQINWKYENTTSNQLFLCKNNQK